MTETATGIVADGRTVNADHPTEMVLLRNESDHAPAVWGKKTVAYGPGDQVTLPVDEIKQLQQQGYLVDLSKIAEMKPD